MIVVDTTILSLVFRRRRGAPRDAATLERWRELIIGGAPLAVPGIALQELFSGVRPEQAPRLHEALRGYRTILADRSTHLLAAELANRCARAGVSAATVDCLIAAHKVAGNARLFTVDDDFKGIAKHTGLRLYVM